MVLPTLPAQPGVLPGSASALTGPAVLTRRLDLKNKGEDEDPIPIY